MAHVMVDLETQGIRPTSIILSLGAVVFDPATGKTGAEFYRNVEVASCEAIGLTRDKSTMDWWLEQSAEARAALEPDQKPVTDVIRDFTAWWKEASGTHPWSHGATFDVAILENIYQQLGLNAPWDFWNVRCCRTILACANRKIYRPKDSVHHNALDDAKAQAVAIAACFRDKQFSGR